VIRVLWIIRNREQHPLDVAVEAVADRAVVRGHRGARILTDIAAIIGGEDHRLRHGDVAFAGRFSVHKQGHLAALAEAAAGVSELHAHLVLAREERARGLDEVVVHASHVVAVFELAVFRVEAPTTDVRTLGYDYALGA
jgi:hypothetical protein